jgi:two-component system response regulator LytT
MLKTVIIEDEKPSARRLSRMVEGLEISNLALLHSVEEAITWFKLNEHPDIIFLDIQLSDGLSFEIFEAVNVNSAIIFTTAYDAYALKAFKLNSIDYLLKPIDKEELAIAVNKFKTLNLKPPGIDIEAIQQLLSQQKAPVYKTRFSVKVGQHLKLIEVSDISCFYSENKSTLIQTSENRSFVLDSNLDQLESDLNPAQFFRVSRKFIVNIKAIKDIISYTNSRLEIKLNPAIKEFNIIVSRERVKAFKEWLN